MLRVRSRSSGPINRCGLQFRRSNPSSPGSNSGPGPAYGFTHGCGMLQSSRYKTSTRGPLAVITSQTFHTSHYSFKHVHEDDHCRSYFPFVGFRLRYVPSFTQNLISTPFPSSRPRWPRAQRPRTRHASTRACEPTS